MKKINYLLASALFIAAGCEKSPVDQGTTDEGNVYMQFSVKMLSTRSQTDNEGEGNSNSDATPDTEVGLAKENTISTVDIVLVGSNTVKATNVTPVAADGSTYVAKFDKKTIAAGKYDVYIYANCTSPETFAIDQTSDADVSAMTQDNKFWMTNAYAAAQVDITAEALKACTTPQNPYNLGAHTVERSMARFDYKQSGAFNMGAGITLTLTDAALINQSKAHYMFRRVTAGSEPTATNAVVGGAEVPTNWVVDTDWSNKVAGNFDAQLSDPSNWHWTSLASLTTNDNYDGDYKIWCYAKENTIPGTTAQKHNVSTGVVFKAELAAGEGASTAVKDAMADGKRIYVFNNVLYGAWSDVKAAAEAGTDATLQAAYNQAATGVVADAEPTGAAAAAAGFTGYSAKEDGKYYNYYYYWNRHNDNLDNNVMGIMEFAVVRNNVYKLAVNSINRFGHPTPPDPSNPDPDPEPDPDPVDPDDPDESVNYYFNVTVKVLPWTVRINNIEF